MPDIKIADIETNPFFELEDYMNLAGESRLDNSAMREILKYWENWAGSLRAKKLECGSNSWLAVWLPEDVEIEVDEIYAQNAAQGHLLNTLATYVCMAAVSELIPHVASGGCAPAPIMIPELAEALEQAGLSAYSGTTDRRYSVLTYYPFKGGCEICQARDACPKMGGNEFASIVLPGYEPEKRD